MFEAFEFRCVTIDHSVLARMLAHILDQGWDTQLAHELPHRNGGSYFVKISKRAITTAMGDTVILPGTMSDTGILQCTMSDTGILQGLCLSLLLLSLLNNSTRQGDFLFRLKFHQYADDVQIYLTTYINTSTTLLDTPGCMTAVYGWFAAQLSRTKTGQFRNRHIRYSADCPTALEPEVCYIPRDTNYCTGPDKHSLGLYSTTFSFLPVCRRSSQGMLLQHPHTPCPCAMSISMANMVTNGMSEANLDRLQRVQNSLGFQ